MWKVFIIPANGRPRQEDHKYQTSLGYIVKSSKKKQNNSFFRFLASDNTVTVKFGQLYILKNLKFCFFWFRKIYLRQKLRSFITKIK
jgi:hypothetical protein